jgi:outer membrane protein
MKRILILTILFLFSASLFAQKKLTIEEAISIALQRNSNLIKGTNSLQINEAEIKNAYGELLPDFGISGSWDWRRISDDGGQTQIGYLGEQIVTPATQSDTRNYSVYAGGRITLFDGLSNYAKISQKNLNLEAAKLSLEKLKQDIVFNTTTYFYAVISSGELVKVREDNVKFNQKLLETISEKNKVGSVALADVYTQQVQLGNAQLLLIQAKNAYEDAKNNLLNYLALDIMETFEFVDPYVNGNQIEENGTENISLANLIKEAFEHRYDYHSKKLDIDAADKGITIAQSGLLPSITGKYSFSSSSTKPANLFERRVYNVGLTLNVPIFSNWRTETSMQYAEVQKLNEMENLSVLERTIKIEVKKSYLDLVASKKRLEVSTANVQAAKENRRVNNERYNLGSGTILDVLQSDKDYTQALTENIKARFEYHTNRDKLMNALGKLDFKKYQ